MTKPGKQSVKQSQSGSSRPSSSRASSSRASSSRASSSRPGQSRNGGSSSMVTRLDLRQLETQLKTLNNGIAHRKHVITTQQAGVASLNKKIQKAKSNATNLPNLPNANVVKFMKVKPPISIFSPPLGSKITMRLLRDGPALVFTKHRNYGEGFKGGQMWRVGNRNAKDQTFVLRNGTIDRVMNHISLSPVYNKSIENWYLGNIHFTDKNGRHFGLSKAPNARYGWKPLQNKDQWDFIYSGFSNGLKELAKRQAIQTKKEQLQKEIDAYKKNKNAYHTHLETGREQLSRNEEERQRIHTIIEEEKQRQQTPLEAMSKKAKAEADKKRRNEVNSQAKKNAAMAKAEAAKLKAQSTKKKKK